MLAGVCVAGYAYRRNKCFSRNCGAVLWNECILPM